MSRSTLTRKLKAITGRTPLDFIRNIKMKHARHMLEDKDKSVTEVEMCIRDRAGTMEVSEKFGYELPAYSFTVIRINKNEK